MEIEVSRQQMKELLYRHCPSMTYDMVDRLLKELLDLTFQNHPPKKSFLDRFRKPQGTVEFP